MSAFTHSNEPHQSGDEGERERGKGGSPRHQGVYGQPQLQVIGATRQPHQPMMYTQTPGAVYVANPGVVSYPGIPQQQPYYQMMRQTQFQPQTTYQQSTMYNQNQGQTIFTPAQKQPQQTHQPQPTSQQQPKGEKKALVIIDPYTNKPIVAVSTTKAPSKSPEPEPVLPIVSPTTDANREQEIGEVLSAAIKENSQPGPGPVLQLSAAPPPIAQPTHPFFSKTVTQDKSQPIERPQGKTLKEEKSVKVENWEEEQTQELWRREEPSKEDLEEEKEGVISDSDEGSDEPESKRSFLPHMQPSSRLKYDREYLLSFRFLKECKEPPRGLIYMDNNILKMIRRPVGIDSIRRDAFLPHYHPPPHAGTKRNSKSGRSLGRQTTPQPAISVSNVELIKSENAWKRLSEVTEGMSDTEKDTTEWMQRLQYKLSSAGNTNDEVVSFIEKNHSQECRTPSFVFSLSCALGNASICGSGDSAIYDSELFKRRCPVLKHFVDNDYQLQEEVIYGLQVTLSRKEHPKDVLDSLFTILYENNVVGEEPFLNWEERDREDLEGRGVALMSVKSFLTWLKLTNYTDSSDLTSADKVVLLQEKESKLEVAGKEESRLEVAEQENESRLEVAEGEKKGVATTQPGGVPEGDTEEICSLQQQLATQKRQLATQERQLGKQEHQLTTQEEQLATQGHQLGAQGQQLAIQERLLATQKQQLATQERQLATQRQQLATQQQENRELSSQMEHLTREQGSLQSQNQQLTSQGQQQARQLSALTEQNRTQQQQLTEQRRVTQEIQQQLQSLLQQVQSLQPSWNIAQQDLQITTQVLGRGAWAEVRVGIYQGTRVAVKKMHDVIISNHNRELFEREMVIASKVRHPNLVLFIGAVTTGNLTIVGELMETSLRKLLEEEKLKVSGLRPISKDIACALAYLHSLPDPIVHRDVSSANVLLYAKQEGWCAKLSDFGSANFLAKLGTVAPGAVIYSAPEALHPLQQGPKMDVYSFGILLFEMCVGKLIHQHNLQATKAAVAKWSDDEKKFLGEFALRCTETNVDKRPNMTDFVKQN